MRGIPQGQAWTQERKGNAKGWVKTTEVPEQDGRRDPIRKMENRKESNKVKAPGCVII